MKEFNTNPKLDYLQELQGSFQTLNTTIEEWKQNVTNELLINSKEFGKSESDRLTEILIEEAGKLEETLQVKLSLQFEEFARSITNQVEKLRADTVKEVKKELGALNQAHEGFKSKAEKLIEVTINSYLESQQGRLKELNSIISKSEKLDEQVSKLEDRISFFRRDYVILNEQMQNLIATPGQLKEISNKLVEYDTKMEVYEKLIVKVLTDSPAILRKNPSVLSNEENIGEN